MQAIASLRLVRNGIDDVAEPAASTVSPGRRPSLRATIEFVRAAWTLLFGLLTCQVAIAETADRYLGLVAAGRFDEVVAGLQPAIASGRLSTSELHLLCVSLAKLKDYEQVFHCAERLLSKAGAGDRRSLLFGTEDVTPAAHLTLAEANLELGRFVRAARSAESVVEWYRASGRRENEMLVDAVAVLAIASHRLGSRTDAERYLRLLERISVPAQFSLRKATAVARTALTLGDARRALSALEGGPASAIRGSLMRVLGAATPRPRDNWLWDELPRIYLHAAATLQSGSRAAAGAVLRDLLATPNVHQNGEVYWLAHFDLAAIASAEGRAGEAISHLYEAIRAIERHRTHIHSEAAKIGFVAERQEAYGRLVHLLLDANRAEEAAGVIDRASSRSLVDLLAERMMRADATLTSVERSIVERIAVRHRKERRQDPRGAAGVRNPTLFAFAAEPTDEDGAGALSAPTASLLTVVPKGFADLRAVLSDGEIAVQYFVHGETLVISWFDKARSGGVRLPAPGLFELVKEFRERLSDRRPAGEAGRRLYDLLVRPLPVLGQGRRLVIVPSGPLHYVPFAALTDGRRALVEDHPVLIVPSLSVLQLLRGGEAAPRAITSGMLAFGNPDLGSRQLDLAQAESEVKSLERRFGADVAVRRGASRVALMRRAASYRIVHLAAHGEYDPEVPLRSALLLASEAGEPGELRAEDILALRVDADLVTMSACETGLGYHLRGNEVIGLNRAWLYAGARNVVASLWKVDDESTSRLMEHFYRLLETRDVEEALRGAQDEIRKSRSHPFFWAAFYVNGRGGPVAVGPPAERGLR